MHGAPPPPLLQGSFGSAEPVSRVAEWVSASLRSPTLTYELIGPDRKPLQLTAAGPGGGGGRPVTVGSAGLVPSAILNLRPVGPEAAALAAANVPMLSDVRLAATQAQ